MGVLRANVGGTWVDIVSAGSEEVAIGPSDPIAATPSIELWYDSDAPASAPGVGLPTGGAAGQILTKSSAVDFAAQWQSLAALLAQGAGFSRNLFDNGQFEIFQRVAPASLGMAGTTRLADRWFAVNNGVGASNLVWSTSVAFSGPPMPTGRPRPAHMQYVQMTTAEAAGAVAAGDYLLASQQFIEGINLQHLGFGTADAQPLTVSFDCYCTVSGTFIAELYTGTGAGPAVSKFIGRAFTVAAGVWQTITLTFPGDTTVVIDNDTSARMALAIWLGAGSTYTSGGTLQTAWGTVTNQRMVGISNTFAANVANVFAITNIQLEVGSQATPYDVRRYDDELRACRRQLYVIRAQGIVFGVGQCFAANAGMINIPLTTPFRAAPALTTPGSAAADFAVWSSAGGGISLSALPTLGSYIVGGNSVDLRWATVGSMVAGNATNMYLATATGIIVLSAEI